MTYSSVVLNDSPLVYYHMDETSGTTMTDSSGNAHNGTYTNGPTLAQTGAITSAPTNNAVKFPEPATPNQYASAAIDLSGQPHITVEEWLYCPTFNTGDGLACEFGAAYTSTVNGFIFDMNNSGTSGTCLFGMGSSSGNFPWTDRFPQPSVNVWHHYVLDMDRTAKVNLAYVDGTLQTVTTVSHSGSFNGGNFANSTLFLMCRNGGSLFCPANSLMDEFAIYAGGLSAARVAAHYQAATSKINTLNGLTRGSVKTVNGLAIASVKTKDGLA